MADREADRNVWYDAAAERVDGDPDLVEHRDFILADWPEGDDHFRWVANATADEILSWVEAGGGEA